MSEGRSSDAGSEPRESRRSIGEKIRAAKDIYEGIYFAPYRAAIHREYLKQRDLFFILAFSDLMGVPNPVAFYTLELYPELIDQFHEWHLRLGMPVSPDGGFRCC
jgi:hypothetical protein